MEQIQATLDEVRSVVLELQRMIVTGNEAGLFVRSCTSCLSQSCNTAAEALTEAGANG